PAHPPTLFPYTTLFRSKALLRLQPDLLSGRDLGDGRDVRVPAVVHQSSAPTLVAAARQASISSSVQCLGEPSWCSDRIAATPPFARTGVTIWAARPPYASRIRWKAGSSYARAQSSWTTCRPAATSRATGWLLRSTVRSSRSEATPGAS